MNPKLKNHIEVREMIEQEGFENLVVSKLLTIEGRLATVETSMTWFKFVARGGVLVIAGFFGLDMTGMI